MARPSDGNDVLDVNPWGVLSLGLSGTHNYASGPYYALNNMRTTQSANGGVSYDLFDFNNYRHDIWFEGSDFMVLAFAMNGDYGQSQYFLNQILKNQDASGGIQYSLLGQHNGYWQMTNARAISSTAWLLFALHDFNPFGT